MYVAHAYTRPMAQDMALVDAGLARQPIITHGAPRDGLATALAGLGRDVAPASSIPAAHWS